MSAVPLSSIMARVTARSMARSAAYQNVQPAPGNKTQAVIPGMHAAQAWLPSGAPPGTGQLHVSNGTPKLY